MMQLIFNVRINCNFKITYCDFIDRWQERSKKKIVILDTKCVPCHLNNYVIIGYSGG